MGIFKEEIKSLKQSLMELDDRIFERVVSEVERGNVNKAVETYSDYLYFLRFTNQGAKDADKFDIIKSLEARYNQKVAKYAKTDQQKVHFNRLFENFWYKAANVE